MSSYIINIDEIENDKPLEFDFDDKIEGINSNGNIESHLTIISLGEFIQIKGNLSGRFILECDLCLDEFVLEEDFEIDELFAKNALIEEYPAETELKEGEFITDLQGTKELDLYDLLYQSVIINLPNKRVCGINCKGDNFLKEEQISDPRLDVFKNINIDN